MESIIQIIILVLSGLAVWLVSHSKARVRKWGYVAGLAGQPFWLFTTVQHEQWGLVVLSGWYTEAWARGVINFCVRTRG
jgi:hypothetical protein